MIVAQGRRLLMAMLSAFVTKDDVWDALMDQPTTPRRTNRA
jgi:hypothetical protein